MLQPKKVKRRKVHTGRMRGRRTGQQLSFGDYGLQAPGRAAARQIEPPDRHDPPRQAGGKVWIRSSPTNLQKPAETRMGKGKGTRRSG